ncbi:MAG TPA: ROK family protein [Vicinamibacterales bacterium]
MTGPVLAVDLGGTKTALAHVEADGSIRRRQKLAAAHTLHESVQQIEQAAEGATAVGVIVPGIYSTDTGHAWCPNLWGMEEQPLLDALRSRLHVPVAIDSDRAGYVLGESWLGAARGLRHVVFVSISTGIGVGILADGQVIRGAHGIAGAAGWSALRETWREAYRLCGCWEAESAGPAMARRLGADDAAAVVQAARSGDAAAHAVLTHAARFSGMGIANLISVLNPEAVVLGGGVIQGAGDLLLPPIRAEVARWAQPIAAARCRIEITHLGEDAGLLGAARLALDLS